METLATPCQDFVEEKEFMSLADAVANCQVKAKKTIVRWAKADEVKERYGKTGTSTLERVVPVEWIRGKMKERGLTLEPIFEPVELMENVSFTRNENPSPLGSKVPALFQEEGPPQFMLFFEKLKESQDAQALQVRTLIHESRTRADLIGRAIQENREEGKREIRRFRSSQMWINIALCAGIALLVAGVAFVVSLGFKLNSARTDEMKALRKNITEKMAVQEESIRSEIQGVKQGNRTLRTLEERRAGELTHIRDGIGALRDDLVRREEEMEALIRAKNADIREMQDRLEGLMKERVGWLKGDPLPEKEEPRPLLTEK